MVMKTNYLLAMATVVATSEFLAAFFPTPAFLLLRALSGVVSWKWALSLGIWTRVLSVCFVLANGLCHNGVALFLITHAAGWIVRLLSFVLASIA
jgi:hypothetical protein